MATATPLGKRTCAMTLRVTPHLDPTVQLTLSTYVLHKQTTLHTKVLFSSGLMLTESCHSVV